LWQWLFFGLHAPCYSEFEFTCHNSTPHLLLLPPPPPTLLLLPPPPPPTLLLLPPPPVAADECQPNF
jgi:hypothetical protein